MKNPLRLVSVFDGHFFCLSRKSKVPLKGSKGLNDNPLTLKEAEEWMKKGGNVGFAPGKNCVVLDFDFDEESKGWLAMAKVGEALGEDLMDLDTLIVKTGGKHGGYHVYLHTDDYLVFDRAGIEQEFPGLHIQSLGHYVVAPGSTVEREYEVVNSGQASMPKGVVEALCGAVGTKADRLTALDPENIDLSTFKKMEFIDAYQLTQILDALPVTQYRSNDSWLPVLQACHHATKGDAECKAIFIDWCMRDELYYGQEEKVSKRWDSLAVNAANPVTLYFLKSEIKNLGIPWPLDPVKKEGVKRVESFSHLVISNRMKKVVEDFKDEIIEEEKKEAPVPADVLRSLVEKSSPSTTANETKRYLELIAVINNEIERERLLKMLSTNTGDSITLLKNEIKKILKKDRQDLGEADKWAKRVHKRIYGEGVMLWTDPISRSMWYFKNTHWVQISEQTLLSCIYHYAKFHCQVSKREEVEIEPIQDKILNILKTLTVRDEDLCSAKEDSERPTVYNMLNGQLTIDPETFAAVFTGGHNPDSRLTSVIQACYDPLDNYKPVFDQYMKDSFRSFSEYDQKEMRRHIMELVAYSMQSNKDLATIVMLHGSGANGKSVLLKIMGDLLAGEASVWMGVKELENDKFAQAGLVGKNIFIDQDTNTKDVLQDGVLKKLSENSPWQVRQIYKDSQNVQLHITPWLACNNFNKLPDPSDGFGRRFCAIPFHSRVADEDQNPRILVGMKKETSAILNEVVEAGIRLRKRGGFRHPEPCKQLKDQWLQSANPIHAFLAEYTDKQKDGAASSDDLYKAYLAFSSENSSRYPVTKRALIDALDATGSYQITMSDRTVVRGLVLKGKPSYVPPVQTLIARKDKELSN